MDINKLGIVRDIRDGVTANSTRIGQSDHIN